MGRGSDALGKVICKTCRNARDQFGRSCYCIRYGIIIGYSKIKCDGYERGANREQIPGAENGSGRDHLPVKA